MCTKIWWHRNFSVHSSPILFLTVNYVYVVTEITIRTCRLFYIKSIAVYGPYHIVDYTKNGYSIDNTIVKSRVKMPPHVLNL